MSTTAMRTQTPQIKNLIGLRKKNDKVEGKQSCCMCGRRLRRTILCRPLKEKRKITTFAHLATTREVSY